MRDVTWPGTDRMVGILYLHCVELQDAYFAARSRFDEMRTQIDPVGDPFFDREYSWQLCQRMLVQPGIRVVRPLFADIKQARAELSPNEIDYFMRLQNAWQDEVAESWGVAVEGGAGEDEA